MIKEILLVTNYYPPEKGAAANRMASMANALVQSGYRVRVVCPLPNYPSGKIFNGYRGKLYTSEVNNGVKISRLWIWPSHSQNKFIRLLSMLSFSGSLKIFFIFKRIPKKVLIQYSPVFIGFTAVFWSRLLNKKVVLNVSDLWPLAGLEMGLIKKGFYYSILEVMERFCLRKAHLVVGQSNEIIEHVSKLSSKNRKFRYRNIPNFPVPPLGDNKSTHKIRLVYAGLLGIAQGLYSICTNIHLPSNIELHIYGSGPEATKIKSLSSSNIYFHGEMERSKLHQELQTYDMALIPLVNRIYGSVPSKIFEYSRLGLPLIYFAGGEGEKLVQDYELGWVVPAGKILALQEFIDQIHIDHLAEISKESVQKNSIRAFNFESQFENFEEILKEV